MGLLVMILGLVLFFAAHVFTTKRDARAQAIARLGEGTYKILYALVSLAGLALIVDHDAEPSRRLGRPLPHLRTLADQGHEGTKTGGYMPVRRVVQRQPTG